METEDHYRQKAKGYRSSPEYGKMISLYPVLETTINACKGESLIAQGNFKLSKLEIFSNNAIA